MIFAAQFRKTVALVVALIGVAFGRASACPVVTVISDPDPPTNIRSGPSVQEPILTTLPNGQPIAIDGHRGGWAHISSPVTGFVSARLTLTTTTPCDNPALHSSSVIQDAVRNTVHSQEFWNTFWHGVGSVLQGMSE